MGSIYFSPLAWHLATRTPLSLLDVQGWADVSRWAVYPPAAKVPLRSLVKRLPSVLHPSEDPAADRAGWCQLFSHEITVFGEADLPAN
jgi:hypothetical protein